MRRVVVTGLGLVTPLATGVEASWKRLLAGESGAGRLTRFDPSRLNVRYGCEIARKSDDRPDGFDPDEWMEPREQRRVDDFILYGMAAAKQAIRDSGWQPTTEEERWRTGVIIGSGIGGLEGIAEAAITLKEKGPRRISPFFIPGRLINLVSGQVSIEFGFKGPNHAVVTACSTGAHAIGDGARFIALDDADVMVAGGAESAISELGVAGPRPAFVMQSGVNDQPRGAKQLRIQACYIRIRFPVQSEF